MNHRTGCFLSMGHKIQICPAMRTLRIFTNLSFGQIVLPSMSRIGGRESRWERKVRVMQDLFLPFFFQIKIKTREKKF